MRDILRRKRVWCLQLAFALIIVWFAQGILIEKAQLSSVIQAGKLAAEVHNDPRPVVIDRPPLRFIKDSNPSFSAVAVDSDHNMLTVDFALWLTQRCPRRSICHPVVDENAGVVLFCDHNLVTKRINPKASESVARIFECACGLAARDFRSGRIARARSVGRHCCRLCFLSCRET